MTEQIYAVGTLLRHHAGSTWKVMAYVEGDYTILCTIGTVRPGRIGGEVDGAVWDGIHADYLHGDGWIRLGAAA